MAGLLKAASVRLNPEELEVITVHITCPVAGFNALPVLPGIVADIVILTGLLIEISPVTTWVTVI